MSVRRLKLLISSVGSLVGQNILNVLEYPGASRRSLVEVVGTNSLPESPSNFRCDRCYLVPEAKAPGYNERIAAILVSESPDLILCGRDEDVLVLSRLKSAQPNLPGALPCSSPHAALVAYDKWQTCLFSQRHGLPFAKSFMAGESGTMADLRAFCEDVGYPLVAKPARGFASRGVFFLRGPDDLVSFREGDGTIFQEFLGDRAELAAYCRGLSDLPRLFTQFEDAGHYSCQTVISPTGEIAPVFVMFNEHSYGETVWNWIVSDPELVTLTQAYADALVSEGGKGPLNVQFRRDARGKWKVQEINLRATGSTLARFLLGQDELHLVVRAFASPIPFPEMSPSGSSPPAKVSQRRFSYVLPESGTAALKTAGVWP
jgi:hypothetical protein